jgi:putative ABC transport system permease protein
LLQDVRYGVRVLAKSPGFTLLAALTLALGMGANTAIFSLADAVLFEPLPYEGPASRVMIWSRWRGFEKTWVNPAEMLAYKAHCQSLRDVAFWRTGQVNLTGDGEPVRVGAGYVSANTFSVLGARPAQGRAFTEDEDRPEGPRAVVLGYALWQGRYAGDTAVLGRSIAVDGVPRQVVGIMPAGFALPTDFGEDAAEPTQLWLPRAPDAEDLTEFGSHSDYGAAWLAPGASVAVANQELRAVTARMAEDGTHAKEMQFTAFALSLGDEILGPSRPLVTLLAGAVALLLLIGCANVANLLLARAEGRGREMAVRSALGAPRGRLVRQLVTEGLLLALLGALLSLALADTALRLMSAAGLLQIPRALAATVDRRALLFALALSAATTVLFALAPALHTIRTNLADALKEGGARMAGSLARRRWRGALIVGEAAFAVVLAVGAGLMARSLNALGRIDLGLEPAGVLTLRLALAESAYPQPEQVVAFYRALLDEVRALPGVRHAGMVRALPLGHTIGDWGLQIEGQAIGVQHGSRHFVPGDWQVASDGAAEALGERLQRGRLIERTDTAEGEQVAVINAAMARKYWPDQDPIGRRFRMGGRQDRPWISVVGVVGDVRHNGITGVVKPKFYRPHAQFHRVTGLAPRGMTLVVKAEGEPLRLVAPIRAALARLDPSVPIANVRTMEEVVKTSKAAPRLAGGLLALFAGIALALAAVGVYGVLSYAVTERTSEIGVRMALGAEAGQVLSMVLLDGLRLALSGVGLGVLLALALTRLMRSLLHEVSPADPVTFAIVAGLLTLVASAASFLPARRATRVDPATALRCE